jgi:death on curing protein
MEPLFLTYDEVLAIHEDQIRRYGGLPGLRDEGLLLSALAVPQAGFGDMYAHADLFEMAACLFHLAKNHPFRDGNKRVGAVASRVFLALNGIVLDMPDDEAYDLVIATAEGHATKQEIAEAFRDAAATRE